ncbi:MAG: hypothetical protein RL007_772 [Bacteroidota bacterium]
MTFSDSKILNVNTAEQSFRRSSILQFIAILIQLTTLLLVVKLYRIESQNGLPEILTWITGAFVVHAALPVRFRNMSFVLFCWAAILYLFGPTTGLMIISFVLAFVITALLPIKYKYRLALIISGAAVLIALRKNIIYMPRVTLAATFAGFMLMFRLIIFMHDVRYEKNNPGIWKRLSYFFMLPNLCFPLFPAVDYQTFLKSEYNDDEFRIHRKGIRWLIRGVVHLLLYRLIYKYAVPSPASITDPADLLQFAATSYLLILRMSGVFYLAVGSLHLFGYNLPPLFNNFFLIPNLSEIWRRINIYWREFIIKVFYYPIWFRLRKIKHINTFVLAGLITFFITWQMHSWQWFWVLGKYPFTAIDFMYWLILGTAVTFSNYRESKKGPAREKDSKQDTWIASLRYGIGCVMIFLFMSTLWSLWNSPDFNSWMYTLRKGLNVEVTEYSGVVLIIAGVIFMVGIIHNLNRKLKIDIDKPLNFSATFILCMVFALPLIAIQHTAVQNVLPENFRIAIQDLSRASLNQQDKENAEQGYYEQLLEDPTKNNPWEVRINSEAKRENVQSIIIPVNNILQRKFKPNSTAKEESFTLTTNSWGMRDREYALNKSKGTYRIALLGGSYEMGSGVNDGKNYESLLETYLNELLIKNDSIERIEILNFSLGGYHLPQQVWLMQNEVVKYNPDAVIYVAHSEDERRLNGFLASSIQNGVPLSFPYLTHIREKSGAEQSLSRNEIKDRLSTYSDSIFIWGYQSIVENCISKNISAIWLYLPATADNVVPAERSHQQKMAEGAGFRTIVIEDPYRDVSIHEIQLSENDSHPNENGHALIASKILSALVNESSPVFPKLQFKQK